MPLGRNDPHARSSAGTEAHTGRWLICTQSIAKGNEDAQVRVYARDTCVYYGVWRGIKPPFRLPVIRVRSPNFRVAVCCIHRNDDIRIVWNENLVHFLTVQSNDGSRQRKNSVLSSAVIHWWIRNFGKRVQGFYVLDVRETGGFLDSSSILAEIIMERMVCIQSQGFFAYCIKIWQSNQFIVTQVARFSRLCDLLTKLILNILVDGKKK